NGGAKCSICCYPLSKGAKNFLVLACLPAFLPASCQPWCQPSCQPLVHVCCLPSCLLPARSSARLLPALCQPSCHLVLLSACCQPCCQPAFQPPCQPVCCQPWCFPSSLVPPPHLGYLHSCQASCQASCSLGTAFCQPWCLPGSCQPPCRPATPQPWEEAKASQLCAHPGKRDRATLHHPVPDSASAGFCSLRLALLVLEFLLKLLLVLCFCCVLC
uniref:Uncharacterized protein n=1 Tax=Laticauda laticaudata TaxID=8630 RepID=A0A8C5RZ59_LATLA